MLLVVDMQPNAFRAAQDKRTVRAIVHLIEDAKKKREGIIALAYHRDGLYGFPRESDTALHPKIVAALDGYDRWVLVWKWRDDGGAEVANAARVNGYGVSRIRVCGVNTEACVYHTVYTLSRIWPKSRIRVVAEACNGPCGYTGWADKLPNTRWVG
jgi:nicotinamidase-related amidase